MSIQITTEKKTTVQPGQYNAHKLYDLLGEQPFIKLLEIMSKNDQMGWVSEPFDHLPDQEMFTVWNPEFELNSLPDFSYDGSSGLYIHFFGNKNPSGRGLSRSVVYPLHSCTVYLEKPWGFTEIREGEDGQLVDIKYDPAYEVCPDCGKATGGGHRCSS